nr:uncharacterized protein LOC111419898 [Onthophagus taurus]
MAHVRKSSTRDKLLKDDLMDRFHAPNRKVCDIIKIQKEDKLDPFYIYRPPPRKYLDYSISQTYTKMDAGPTKIHYSEIHATYIPFPDDYVPPPPGRHAQHGRGPVWLFWDELYKIKVEKRQAKYRIAMEERLKRKAAIARAEKIRKRKLKRKKAKQEIGKHGMK